MQAMPAARGGNLRRGTAVNAKDKRTNRREAAWAGFDLSTTGLALGVRSRAGEEAYVQTKMRGAHALAGAAGI